MVGIKLVHAYRPLTTSELLGTIDFVVDILLVLVVEVCIGEQADILLHHIRVNASYRQ
jgi:hypothetical protein